GIPLLGPAWFTGGFRTNYLPWGKTVVAQQKDHPAIFAWEPGNELRGNENHPAFIQFAAEVGGVIRGLDPKHLIASGMITAAWMTPAEARTLSPQPTPCVTPLHDYSAAHPFKDACLSRELKKPMIQEEGGFDSGDRP